MTAHRTKIVTKLRERREIEADLRQMLSAGSEVELQQRAQQIASRGLQVISAILGNLDRADEHMLRAMSAVASYLDREQATRALSLAAADPLRAESGRKAAKAILEQFLGPGQALGSGQALGQAEDLSALPQLLDRSQSEPVILASYVQELDHQEPDIVLEVVEALRALPECPPDDRPVELLRMLAQDVREEIASEAVQALGARRSPEAARAVQTLLPALSPALGQAAARLLRKLQFAGVPVEPLPPVSTEWRALISPVYGQGHQNLWFVQENPRTPAHARFLNILVTDQAGAVEAVGHAGVSRRPLPPRRPVGYVHDVAFPDGSGALLMLEAPFDVGRRLVLEALVHNRDTQVPVAGVLRLLSPWLWGLDGASSLPEKSLPALSEDDRGLVAISDRLLSHPAFATWMARMELSSQVVEEVAHRPGWDLDLWVKRLAADLFSEPGQAQVLSRRLEAMSEWLLLAADEMWSRLALATSCAILGRAPYEVPLVQALIRKDLELALQSKTTAQAG